MSTFHVTVRSICTTHWEVEAETLNEATRFYLHGRQIGVEVDDKTSTVINVDNMKKNPYIEPFGSEDGTEMLRRKLHEAVTAHQNNLKDTNRALAWLAPMECYHGKNWASLPVVRHALESIMKRACIIITKKGDK